MHSIISPLSASPLLVGGRGGSSPKNDCLGDLKSSCHGYLPGTAYYVSCQKRLSKIKYGFVFDSSISNVDLGLF